MASPSHYDQAHYNREQQVLHIQCAVIQKTDFGLPRKENPTSHFVYLPPSAINLFPFLRTLRFHLLNRFL